MPANPVILNPGVCPVCLRVECGAGYMPPGRNATPLMMCETDIHLGKTVYRMFSQGLLHRVEAESLRAAGATAGNWLLAHGETDLAKLTPDAWETFLGLFLSDFANQMRARLAPAAAAKG